MRLPPQPGSETASGARPGLQQDSPIERMGDPASPGRADQARIQATHVKSLKAASGTQHTAGSHLDTSPFPLDPPRHA